VAYQRGPKRAPAAVPCPPLHVSRHVAIGGVVRQLPLQEPISFEIIDFSQISTVCP
jgi:hypothetical protein